MAQHIEGFGLAAFDLEGHHRAACFHLPSAQGRLRVIVEIGIDDAGDTLETQERLGDALRRL